jgi:hypothetical protein
MPIITGQTGGRQFVSQNFTKFGGFVSGTNATHHVLKNISPLQNGYIRLFMVRSPKILLNYFAVDKNIYSTKSKFIQVKHMMEYYLRSITGFGERSLERAQTPIQGGYAGRNFNTPTVTKDATESFMMGLYEWSGSPVFEVVDTWMNMIGDENSGLAHYGGQIAIGKDDKGLDVRMFDDPTGMNVAIEYNEANHTAEFICVLTDKSGCQVERAMLLADVFPTQITQGVVLDMPAGATHDNVAYDIQFNCEVYRSPIITSIANDLLKKYRIVSNSLNFNPLLGDIYKSGQVGVIDEVALGEVPYDSSYGTHVGNAPVYDQTVTAKSEGNINLLDIEQAKLEGDPMSSSSGE